MDPVYKKFASFTVLFLVVAELVQLVFILVITYKFKSNKKKLTVSTVCKSHGLKIIY